MTSKYEDLQGKTAIITGASRGIGKSIAEGFCSCGVNVALFDVDKTALGQVVSEFGEKYPEVKKLDVVCDISDTASVTLAVERVHQELGEIDILVNNAGILKRSLLENMPESDWQAVLAVNLSGTYFCSKAVIPSMSAKGGGVIINVSSNVVARPSVGMGAYCVSKSGIEILTRVLASELAPHHIRVNAYAPGVVTTEMTKDIMALRAEEKLRTIPLRRFASPEEITNLVLFLSSSSSAYINGTVIAIDGGMLSSHNPWKAWE